MLGDTNLLFFILGATIVVMVLVDMIGTIFGADSAGPFSRVFMKISWRAILTIHNRKPFHRILSYVGPILMICTISFWYVFTLGGFWLIVMSDSEAATAKSSAEVMSPADKFYFVSSTVSSLGYGDYVPLAFPWTAVSGLMTFLGTFVLTLSLSYVISVLSAATERRSLGQTIFGGGNTLDSYVSFLDVEASDSVVSTFVLSTCDMIDGQAQKHLAYPVLKYFHSVEVETAASRALLLFADAMFLRKLQGHDSKTMQSLAKVFFSSVEGFLEINYTAISDRDRGEKVPEALTEVGPKIGLTESEISEAFASYHPLRKKMLDLCEEDGWRAPDRMVRYDDASIH